MKMLIIAEKPSVSQAIAGVLGVRGRRDGYLEGNRALVTWCLGHLVELAQAEAYDARYARWSRDDLPIVPNPWAFVPREKTRKQLDLIRRLAQDRQVDSIVCATDAGREGELIFRLVYTECGCTKPVKRLWISSMEEEAIRDGFDHLRDASEYDHLYEAALCRAKADWLVGINMTRLLSTMYGCTLNVGRVMSPTLSMIAQREREIMAFVPEPFYTVVLSSDWEAVSERMKEKAQAEAMAAACQGKAAVIRRIERRERMQNPPLLYDLTTLQREANRMFGFTAQQTLDYAQSLYEKRLLTYPRTDSRYLRTEQQAMLPDLVKDVAAAFPFSQGMMLPINAAQVVRNAAVTDHHAIIPTRSMPKADLAALPAGERSILTMIAARLMCAVGDAHRYEETEVTLECGGQTFRAKGKRVTNMGWKRVDSMFRGSFGIRPEDDGERSLPELFEGMTVDNVHAAIKMGTTKPPARYTEDALLLAMERAGDGELPESAEHRGIGTPATRAGIIEKLIRGGFIERRGDRKAKSLVPTDKGMNLAAVLPDKVKSAQMTAEWERMLADVERGAMTPEAFMDAIERFIAEEVRIAAPAPDAQHRFAPWKNVVGVCPRCGSPVVETDKGFFCDRRDCHLAIWKNNRFFAALGRELTRDMALALLKSGRISLDNLRSQKSGKLYSAEVALALDEHGNVQYRLEFPQNRRRPAGGETA